MIGSLAIALLGIAVAWFLYVRRPELPARIAERLGGFYRLVANKYYVDEAYRAAVVRPLQNGSRLFLWRVVDVMIIDFLVNLVGMLSKVLSYFVRFFQTGYVQFYAAVLLLSVAILFWVMF